MRAIPREVSDAFAIDADHAYAFGLWCADGYWWSSSIGLTSVEPELVLRFANCLLEILPPERLRLRIYKVDGCEPDRRVTALTSRVSVRPPSKMKRTAYQVYVNSRPLLRHFQERRRCLDEVPDVSLGPYFAGRFDGDGSWGDTPRIAYTTRGEAEGDVALLARAGITEVSVLFYRKANEYCIYIQRPSQNAFLNLVGEHSWKLEPSYHPVETVMASPNRSDVEA